MTTLLPSWYVDNPHLLTGYRPVRASVRACLRSVLPWPVHNETVNIWTHLLGAVAAAGCLWGEAQRWMCGDGGDDALFLALYLAGAVAVLGGSAVAHTMFCHSESVCAGCLRADYACIALYLAGWCAAALHFARLGDVGPYQAVAGLGFVACAARAAWDPHFFDLGDGPLANRLLTFAAPVVAGLAVPLVRSARLRGFVGLHALAAGPGLAAYALRIPERWFPRRFDLFGASHQLWHLGVLAGLWVSLQFCFTQEIGAPIVAGG